MSLWYWIARFEEESLLEICEGGKAERCESNRRDEKEKVTENSLLVHLEMSESVSTSIVGFEAWRPVVQSSRTVVDRSIPSIRQLSAAEQLREDLAHS